MADAVLGADIAGEGYGGMLLVGGEPCLGILGVLPGEVVGVFLIASRAGEDAHELNGFRDLYFDLCRHCEGGDGEDD